jgi:hypothetical protein
VFFRTVVGLWLGRRFASEGIVQRGVAHRARDLLDLTAGFALAA